jgi:hypothetical protein
MILKNRYVRATLIVLLLTLMTGFTQANVSGPAWMLTFTGFTIGVFITIILFIMSIFSLRKNSKQAYISTMPTPVSEAVIYKKRFFWCLIIAAPGVLIWSSAFFTTRNGGGEAYLAFIPLLFVSFAAILAALLYGIAFLVKRGK